MKRLVLAAAIAAISMTAQAAPTVYGKIFLSVDTVDSDTDTLSADRSTVTGTTSVSRSKLNSTASRVGFKGSEPLTANTDVVYQLEYGVKVDDNSSQFSARDTYIGVANKQYGTLVAGRLTAVDNNVNFANMAVGAVDGGDNVLAAIDKPRANNAFAYTSPSYNGLTFQGMYVADEFSDDEFDADGKRLSNNGSRDTFGRDVYGVAAIYKPSTLPLRAGVSWMQGGDNLKTLRISGDYKVTPKTTIGALYQNTDLGEVAGRTEKENAYTVSASYQTDTPWKVYGQADYVDNASGFEQAERQRYILGAQYAFNKAATGHLYASYRDEDRVKGQSYFVGGGTTTFTKDEKYEGYGVGAGIEYKF